MFLDVLVRRNPAFVSAAISLQQEGAIPAAAYVLDLDAVEHNAGLIAAEAARLHLDVFAMTKQVGRHPGFIAAVRRGGIDAGVAVDMECVRALRAAGMRMGWALEHEWTRRKTKRPVADSLGVAHHLRSPNDGT